MRTVKTFFLSLSFCCVLLFGLSFGVAAEEYRDEAAFSAPVPGASEIMPLDSGITLTGPFMIWNSEKEEDEYLTYTVPSPVVSHGIDVSKWQGNIDWEKVKAAGVDFALIRVGNRGTGEGKLSEDPYFHRNMIGAKEAGIKVGVYIFSQAITVDEALEEAAFVLRLVKNYDLDLPIVLDYEYATGDRLELAYRDGTLDKDSATDVCIAFCNAITQAGYSPMVYANAYMLSTKLDADRLEEAGDIWLANYTTNTTYRNDFQYWQYTSKGRVDGIDGLVDCNFCFEMKGYGNGGGTFFPFVDVKPGDWYYDQVKYSYDNGLFVGITWDTFVPYGTMTRAMLVSVLYRMEGSPDVSGASKFTDLNGDWYKDAVLWGEQTRIVSGTSETTFEPDSALTREEMVTFIQRYAMYKNYDVFTDGTLDSFPDGGDTSTWAAPAMKWAVDSGYVRGFDDGTLQPRATTNRAQVATVLRAFCMDNNIF